MSLNKFIFGFLFVLVIRSGYSQETTAASGGEASGNGTVSYSIGQIFFSNYTGSNNFSVSQGVQQPFEISITLDIPEFEDIKLTMVVYPNPTTDYLFLNAQKFSEFNLKYTLSDGVGKILSSQRLTEKTTKIKMDHLRSAVYFLNVSDSNRNLVKTFKIIKN